VDLIEAKPGRLEARITGGISGEIVVRAAKRAKVLVDGEPFAASYSSELGAFTVPFLTPGKLRLEIAG
jgi:hypothetical protein